MSETIHMRQPSSEGSSQVCTRYVLVAPDKFKGTFSAAEVASALAQVLRELGYACVELPAADGGEGTAEAILRARGGTMVSAVVSDALGRPVQAQFAVTERGGAAIVDAAAAIGLGPLSVDERDPWRASSAGVGELIVAASAYADEVVVAAGGTATVDGGAGAIEVLSSLERLPSLRVACDVATTWERAAEVFGPQKGADETLITALRKRLDLLATSLPRDPRNVPMSGCGGGLSGGLWSAFQAELVSGCDLVLDALSFDETLQRAALVVTGEGRLDHQTQEGKLVHAVAARCKRAGVPCVVVAGKSDLDSEQQSEVGLKGVIQASSLEELHAAGLRIAELLTAAMPDSRRP